MSYVILYVSDLDRAVAFYRDVAGFAFKFQEHGYAEFATDGARFGLYERGHLPELLGPDTDATRVSDEVLLLVDDVEAEAERVRRAGGRILAGPTDHPWGHRTLHVLGPDGHVVEFAQIIQRAQPRARPERET